MSFSSHAHQRPRKINWRGWGSRMTAVTMETPCHSPWRAARCFGNQEKVNSASEEENRRVRAHRPLAPSLGCSLFPPGCSSLRPHRGPHLSLTCGLSPGGVLPRLGGAGHGPLPAAPGQPLLTQLKRLVCETQHHYRRGGKAALTTHTRVRCVLRGRGRAEPIPWPKWNWAAEDRQAGV